MNTVHESDKGPGLLSNAIAIIAFIVVIAIVIWGLLHLFNISTSWFTNLWPRSTPTMQVSAPATAESGSPVTISWKYSGTDKGTYAFLYQCREGVSIQDANGARVLCGTVHPLMNASSSTMVVTPVLSRVASTTLPFSVIFMPTATGSKQVSGTGTVAITAATETTPEPVATTPTTVTTTVSSPASSYTAGATAATPKGPADLRVHIVSVQTGELTTVQFDIANIGGSASGSYTFTAYLPTADGYTYFSPTQSSLGAGSHIVNTLQFSDSTGGTVSIVVHPSKGTDPSGNNNASRDIASGYTPNYDTYTTSYDQYADYQYPQYPDQYGYSYPQSAQYYGAGYSYPMYQPDVYTVDPYSGYYPAVADESGYYPTYQPQLPDESGYGMYYGY